MSKERAESINNIINGLPAEKILHMITSEFTGKARFASSLGAEDQVITHMLAHISPKMSVFTLDTGRMFYETYELIEKTEARYGIRIEVFFPDARIVEKMVKEKGINLFYNSIENRKQCCEVRKIEPLKRALIGLDAWVTGLRKEQSPTRKDMMAVEWDQGNNMIKVNPLYNWTEEQVWDYIGRHKIPYNTLHDKGFPSIGCQPCSRAIQPGEDIRNGRWWWENPETKECGLHARKI